MALAGLAALLLSSCHRPHAYTPPEPDTAPVAQALADTGRAQATATVADPTPSSAYGDPWPAEPANQIEWAARNHRPAVVLFHSSTGRTCAAMRELLASVRSNYEQEILFVEVATGDRANFPLLREAKVRTAPSFFFLLADGGGRRVEGAMKEAELRAELDALCRE